MSNWITRLRKLAGLNESGHVMSQEERDEQDLRDADARLFREKRMRQLIETAFVRLGIDISDDGIFYDEDGDREAIVILDDTEISLRSLDRLRNSGLAADYTIGVAGGNLQVSFRVLETLDNAV